jgi:hypothetical protein
MSNEYVDVLHTHDYYKGKSMDFAGIWASGIRYFNDEYITNFVVYAVKNADGNIQSSALLACKKTHTSKLNTVVKSRDDNEPRLIVNEGSVVGIEANDYWIFVCGSVQGVAGSSAEVVSNYTAALALATEANIGKLVYVRVPKSAYIVSGAGRLETIVIGDEVDKLQETKVDKIEGKGLSTEDFTTEEKEKLSTVESNAQENVIETIKVNGAKIDISDKTANITFNQNTYTIDKLATPEGDYLASYVLRENGSRTGSTINIPKDKALYSGSVEVVSRNGYPYSGAKIGDKYIDLLLNDSAKTHIYVPANKLVDAYSGDKYINVDSDNKSIKLEYEQLKSDLSSDIKIGVAQVNTLSTRLEKLEDSKSKVVSIGTSTRPLSGVVVLDNRDFTIDTTTNSISLNFNSEDFDTSGMADRVREELLGKPTDVLNYDENSTEGLSLYGVKNALIEVKENFISADDIGEGLTWSEGGKIVLHTKDGSAVQVNEKGEVILSWS